MTVPSRAVVVLEVELVDIVRVKDGRLTQKDRVIRIHGVLAQLAGAERVARLALDLAAGNGVEGVDGQVAEIRWIPERNLGRSAAAAGRCSDSGPWS